MTKFRGTFVQVVENAYKFEIEADTKEEVLKKLDDDPFEYITGADPVDEQGLDIKDIKFEDMSHG